MEVRYQLRHSPVPEGVAESILRAAGHQTAAWPAETVVLQDSSPTTSSGSEPALCSSRTHPPL